MASNDLFFQYYAQVCKTVVNPVRQRIIEAIGRNSLTVTELRDGLDIPLSNLSNHLQILFAAGVVERVRNGSYIRYSLADPELLAALAVMKRVVEAIATRKGLRLMAGQGGSGK
jgi:DNA-binding transcriptional ArsR family regulator